MTMTADSETTRSGETTLQATSFGEQCSNCDAPLADDQRYCVVCGQRRGKGRFAMLLNPPSTTSSTVSTRRSRAASLTGGSGSSALMILLLLLVIAIGVGVLIGRATDSTPKSAAQVITLKYPAGSVGTVAPTATATTPTTAAATPSGKTPKGAVAAPKQKVKIKAAASLNKAAKVIPKKLQKEVATKGQKCTPGEAGCTHGKFTGQFFGGGGG